MIDLIAHLKASVEYYSGVQKGALKVSITDGSGNPITSFGGSGGTSANVGDAFPTSVNPIGVKDNGGLVAPIVLDAAGKVPVSGTFSSTPATAATSTLSNTSANASNVTVLAANASRLGAYLVNDADKIAYVKFGATATTTSYTRMLLPGGMMDVGIYIGKVDAIWEAGPTGAMRVTELTA